MYIIGILQWDQLVCELGEFKEFRGSEPIDLFHNNFYTPVFRRDVLWYGAVRRFVRPSDC